MNWQLTIWPTLISPKVTSFHLKNWEEKRVLEVKWNNTDLEDTPHLKYLGVTLDTTMSYNKQHIHNTKMKVATQNNLLRRSDQTPNGVVTQALLEQLHWHCLTPRLNMRAQFGLDLHILSNWIMNWTTHIVRSPDVQPMSKNYTCLRRLHHLTSGEMYILEWKRKTGNKCSPFSTQPGSRWLKREYVLCSVRPADFPAKLTQLRCQPGSKFSKGVYQSLDSVEMSQQVTHWCSIQQGAA